VDPRDKTVRDRAQEAERYREAAELALDQLEWCINYLNRIRKPTLAKGLKANREQIQAQLRRIAQHGSRL
jgi:thiamine pyrophosphate-dependent acetolactate synthase large subunit-like protein